MCCRPEYKAGMAFNLAVDLTMPYKHIEPAAVMWAMLCWTMDRWQALQQGQCMCRRPDYEACAALAQATLNASDCGAAHCVLGAPQPATSGEFIALAGEPAFPQACLHL